MFTSIQMSSLPHIISTCLLYKEVISKSILDPDDTIHRYRVMKGLILSLLLLLLLGARPAHVKHAALFK